MIIRDSSVGGSSGFNPRVQIIDVVEHASADFEIREFDLFRTRPFGEGFRGEAKVGGGFFPQHKASGNWPADGNNVRYAHGVLGESNAPNLAIAADPTSEVID